MLGLWKLFLLYKILWIVERYVIPIGKHYLVVCEVANCKNITANMQIKKTKTNFFVALLRVSNTKNGIIIESVFLQP